MREEEGWGEVEGEGGVRRGREREGEKGWKERERGRESPEGLSYECAWCHCRTTPATFPAMVAVCAVRSSSVTRACPVCARSTSRSFKTVSCSGHAITNCAGLQTITICGFFRKRGCKTVNCSGLTISRSVSACRTL
jgi:hypothetical protein